MSDKETSDLSMSRVQCPHCDAVWINGKHYWQTGCTSDTSELDLAGLVCNTSYGDRSKCINPKVGMEGGDTWNQRLTYLEILQEEMKEQ